MVVTESGGSWVAELLQRMDGRSERHGIEMAARKPSDVYRRQCYVAHSSFIRRGELEPAVLSDNPNLIWGADSGHGEGSWPGVVDGLRQLVGGLAEDAMREFLGGGALRAYRLDRDRLAATVERIGPSAADLGLVAPSIHHQQAGAG
jgi:hypothetical protein